MAKIFFSKSTMSFFDEDISSSDIPNDAVEISKKRRDELILDIYSGKVLSIDTNGNPVSIDSNISETIPFSVSKSQGKVALINARLLDDVNEFIESIESDVEKDIAKIALNDTSYWHRSSPFLNSAAQAIGLTDEQLDQLFIDASKIEL